MQESSLPVSVLDMSVDFLETLNVAKAAEGDSIIVKSIIPTMTNAANPAAIKKFSNNNRLVPFLSHATPRINQFLINVRLFSGATHFDKI